MKVLVVYHSVQGNTEIIAQRISKILGANLIKINVNETSSGSALMRSPSIIAQWYGLKHVDSSWIDIDGYDTILVGSPCWMYNVSRPVRSFMESHDFSGKRVGLFITHGGSPGETSSKFKKMIPSSQYLGMLEYHAVKNLKEFDLKRDLNRLIL